MRQHKRSGFFRSGLVALGVSVALTAAAAMPARAQDAQKITRPANNKTPVITSGSGPYYIEFRARYAWGLRPHLYRPWPCR